MYQPHSIVSLKMGLLNLKHMKQTAVSWLEQEFIKLESTIGVHGKMYELIEQAKEMEKQQIIDAYKFGLSDEYVIGSEQYYNETYGSKGSDDHIVDTNEGYQEAVDFLPTYDDVIRTIDLSREYNDGWLYTEEEIIEKIKNKL